MHLNHVQLRQIDGQDEIPFMPINTGRSDYPFLTPVPDYIPTDEEIEQAWKDRRMDKARELGAQLSPKVK